MEVPWSELETILALNRALRRTAEPREERKSDKTYRKNKSKSGTQRQKGNESGAETFIQRTVLVLDYHTILIDRIGGHRDFAIFEDQKVDNGDYNEYKGKNERQFHFEAFTVIKPESQILHTNCSDKKSPIFQSQET
jgi:hypothetical protein